MIQEIWKNVENYKGYQVSNLGRVRAFRKSPSGIIMSPATNRKGYLVLNLRKNGENKFWSVHRLVAITFLSLPTKERNQINHKDGNKKNNSVGNLEWVTCRENIQHCYRMGLFDLSCRQGENNGLAKLTQFQVKRIRLMKEITPDLNYPAIGKMFNVTAANVCSIIKRHTWKHIT